MLRVHNTLGFSSWTRRMPLKCNRCFSATFFNRTAPRPPLALEWPRLLPFNRSPTIWSRWYTGKKEVSNRARNATVKRRPSSSSHGVPAWRLRIERIPHNFIIWGILGLNGAVYFAWQFAEDKAKNGDPGLWIAMAKNLLVGWKNIEEGRIWTILTSCFSHSTAGHIFANAFTFYFMAPPVLQLLGNTSFLALYLGGGIASGIVSLLFNKSVNERGGASNGASGAIYSVVSFFACVAPRTTFYFFAIVPVPAWALVTALFVWDGLSTLTDRKTRTDGAGHVGGMIAGAAYYLLKFRM